MPNGHWLIPGHRAPPLAIQRAKRPLGIRGGAISAISGPACQTTIGQPPWRDFGHMRHGVPNGLWATPMTTERLVLISARYAVRFAVCFWPMEQDQSQIDEFAGMSEAGKAALLRARKRREKAARRSSKASGQLPGDFRAEAEDDDGYDPYSDFMDALNRSEAEEPSEDPWR